MTRDPLAAFSDLPGAPKDFPGNRPPVNRGTPPPKKETEHELLGKPKVYPVEGKPVEFFTIGALAHAIGKQPVTLRAWESEGVLPKATFRTQKPRGQQVPGKAVKGQRLYTRKQAELVIAGVERYRINDRKSADWKGFMAFLRKHWTQ